MLVLLFIAASLVVTQEAPSGETFEAWFNSLRVAAVRAPDAPALHVKWRVTTLSDLAQLERKLAEIKDYPDHPDRETLERAIANRGRRFTDKEIWIRRGEWRRSDTFNGDKNAYHDHVVRSGVAWSMTSKQLDIIDPKKGYPDDERLDIEASIFMPEALVFPSGGFSRATKTVASMGIPEVVGGAWTASGHAEQAGVAYESTYSGTWDQVSGTGTVSRASLSASVGKDKVTDGYQFLDWKQEPLWHRPVPHKVIHLDSKGAPESEYQLLEVSGVDDRQFDSLCAIPEESSVDPVRGNVTFTSVLDLRPDKPYLKRPGLDGTDLSVPIEIAEVKRNPAALQYLGWSAAGAIVVLLVVLRIRRQTAKE